MISIHCYNFVDFQLRIAVCKDNIVSKVNSRLNQVWFIFYIIFSF